MRLVKGLMTAAVAAMTVGFGTNAFAFHDGGVAYCEGCHTMHNSKGGAVMTTTNPPARFAGNNYLLQGSDQSSTCLKCHSGSTLSGYKVMTYPVPAAGVAPVQLTPGGDFAYVAKTYSWVNSRGQAGSSAGERHGHNIIAAEKGLTTADATLLTAPGGDYDATKLSCISCHDPHGKYRMRDVGGVLTFDDNKTLGTASEPIISSGSYGTAPVAGEAVGAYRLLAGKNYAPASYAPPTAFNADPPIAVAPGTYNRAETASDTHVAYGKGMSEWCSNCHGQIHNDGVSSNLIHPASNAAALTAAIAANYNAYVKSGDLSGNVASAYSSLVPFEEQDTSLANLLARTTSTAGAEGGENVMCLSCHRAHATAFDSMVRWDKDSTYLTVDGIWPGSDQAGEAGYGEFHRGKTQAEYAKAMYDRSAGNYAVFQRQMCNKCHAKD